MKRIKTIILTSLLIMCASNPCRADTPAGTLAGMRFYSGMNQVKDRDYLGFQITIIPYTGGEKVLWRDQEGGPLKPPLLLDAVSTGTGMKVTVPGTPHPIDWFLIQQGTLLRVQDPWGLHFDLKEVLTR